MTSQPRRFQDCQRIHVARHGQEDGQTVKICIERYDDCLGWYSAGALAIPLHQLPLLQQALEELSARECSRCPDTGCPAKIIPFPTMMPGFAEQPAGEVLA